MRFCPHLSSVAGAELVLVFDVGCGDDTRERNLLIILGCLLAALTALITGVLGWSCWKRRSQKAAGLD
jgi:hypothetical protein